MAHLTLSTSIQAPVATTFRIATDLDRWPQIIRGIRKIEKLTESSIGFGTRFRETREMFGREATEEMEFVWFEPDRRYDLRGSSCGTEYVTTFSFQPDGEKTLLEAKFSSKPVTFLARLMSPLAWCMIGTIRKCLEADLADLKLAAEAEGLRSKMT